MVCKLIRKLIFSILIISCLGLTYAGNIKYLDKDNPRYIGNKSTKVYHYEGCRYTWGMHPKNKIEFNSAKEALDTGYRACKICQPPTKEDLQKKGTTGEQ